MSRTIILNQPAAVTITIRSTVDMSGLFINLLAAPTNVTFGADHSWQYDAVANTSHEFQTTVTFSAMGGWDIAAVVFSPEGGPLVSNQERVVIDSNGAVINPTINPDPMSDLFNTTPMPAEMLTETARAQPTIIEPTRPPVEGFTPQQWLEKCGWSVKKPKTLTLWQNVSGSLDIQETAIVEKTMTGTLMMGFKDDAHPDTPIQARIGLCSFGQGWTTDSQREWNTELRHGGVFETPVALRFTDLGEIPIFVVVYDAKNNRIAGIGRLIWVITEEQSISPPLPSLTPTDTTKSETQMATMAASPQWRLVANEPFNSYSPHWPGASPQPWRVNDLTRETPTDLDRKWGVRQADFAAWPAAGGAAGLLSGNYPNNFKSEMILGPIDTNGAAQAKLNFRMLLNTEKNFDFIRLYTSRDGNGWTEKKNWSGSNGGWSSYEVNLSSEINIIYPKLYLKWVFTSDSGNVPSNSNYSGVWVDDIS